MKILVISVILAGLVMPVFGQDANSQSYKTLSDSMGVAISNSSTRLQNFDKSIVYNGNAKTYASYKTKYDSITKSLQESETKLNRLIQSHDSTANIKAERDRYEGFIKQLEAIKSEYDNWVKTTQ